MDNKKVQNNIFQYLSLGIVLVLFISTIKNGFFWDTVQLGSKHANFYFTHQFSTLLLPDSIDSGHIPAFGFYIGLMWKLFGRSLLVSHIAMLPFIIGIIWQLKDLISFYFKKEQSWLIVFLILLDPTLLSQMTLVSPDVPLVFFFLLCWNGILRNQKIILAISIIFLFLTSMRGMMIGFCFLFIDIFYNINFKDSYKNIFINLLKRSVIYLPALLVFMAFSLYHYHEKGWIGYHEDSPWAGCFQRVDFKGFIFNLGILGWRILDFGRIGIWLVFTVLFLKYSKKILKDKEIRSLFFIFLCFLLILPSNMVWAKNLLAHRYLLPIYLIFSIFVAKILFSDYVNPMLKKTLIFIWIIVVSSGNLWVYPDKIAQGWDSTLAHLPYYRLRNQTINYLEDKKIDFDEVYTFFPNNNIIDDIDLNGDFRSFKNYEDGAKYVIYSNVFNISDEEYDALANQYILIKEFRSPTAYIKIYKIKKADF